MPKFSRRSLDRLSTCHPLLQEICQEVVEVFDITVLEGHRSRDRQEQMVREGKSQLHWPRSRHNTTPSMAVDIAPWPIDWEDWKRWYFMGGLIKGIASQRGISIRWGGDWDSDNSFKDQNFNDLPHIELRAL